MRARNLTKRYGDLEAVRGISFEVRGGEFFGFLGPNGAGKTSTIKMIYGAAQPTAGALEVLGVAVTPRSWREVKRGIGVVAQEETLDTEISVLENMLVFARYFGISRGAALGPAEEILARFELAEKAHRRVQELSGGMKRRLMLARALVSEPRLLILDEPTSGLDPAARHMVWDQLRRLKAGGVTILLTTHTMDEAERLCDRLVIIDEGSIIAEGAPRQLIAAEIGREVLEIHDRQEVLDLVVDILDPAADRYQRTDRAVILAVDDAEEALHRLRAAGCEPADAHLRRATLEDVFLKLAGRRLET